MIIVTGATGALGSRIVDRLLERVPAERVGVSARDPEKAAGLAGRGVRVRAGDFTDPASLEHAFEGAEQVLVVSAAIRGPGAAAANIAAIDAAAGAGARRILYTSHQAASPTSLFPPQRTHAATEAHLASLGVPFVALRNGFYANALGLLLGDAARSGRLVAPQDGPVSWTAHADLAQAAVAALLDDDLPDGATAPLTAPAALDLEAVAAIAGDLAGRPVRRVVVEDDEWRATAIAGGMPEPAADFTLGLYRAARDGEFAVTDPTLERLLGRPAVPVRTALEALVVAG
ncbi:unannotated protein [freshwater metagenome]|uniref:Unannotated protein n=1 Tax=freshwater metagenome TaxID=449393 RepID=A0A6J7HJY6_9ZZZZ|nr:NAD(P)H-binding protein [Actinomycetota bacterium]